MIKVIIDGVEYFPKEEKKESELVKIIKNAFESQGIVYQEIKQQIIDLAKRKVDECEEYGTTGKWAEIKKIAIKQRLDEM